MAPSLVVVTDPLRPQFGDGGVEIDRDAAAHGHHHGLAVHDFQPLLEVLDQIVGDQLDAVLGADDGLQLRPFGLELLLALDLFPFGGLVEIEVEVRDDRRAQLQLGQAALVVDRHRGAVLDRPLDVVDADVVAEDGARAGVGRLDGRAGEADEGGVGERVVHEARVAVDEVVLAAMGFVGDDHDVAAVREERMPVPLLFGEEFLDGGEDHATGRDRKLLAQVGPVSRLHRRLAQQILAAGEGAEELVVQIVAVGDDHDGRVGHGWMEDQATGVEGHGEALAGALRVPDHADALVADVSARLMTGNVGAALVAMP